MGWEESMNFKVLNGDIYFSDEFVKLNDIRSEFLQLAFDSFSTFNEECTKRFNSIEQLLKDGESFGNVYLNGYISKAIKIINEESVNVYSENFKYDDIINIEKDSDGNITMIRADTVKQNYLASQVVLKCNKRLSELEDLGVKIPLGYLTNNVMFYNMGPKITVKMQQVGNITTSYESEFESAGINQTRHRIYLNLKNCFK